MLVYINILADHVTVELDILFEFKSKVIKRERRVVVWEEFPFSIAFAHHILSSWLCITPRSSQKPHFYLFIYLPESSHE